MRRAFSLMELLVALGVLALVAAIVVPRFLNVKDRASDSVAAELASQLNRTYASWVASGGMAGDNVYTSDLLYVLGSPDGARDVIRGSPLTSIRNGGSSQNIRLDLSPELQAAAEATMANPQLVVAAGSSLLYFDRASQLFVVGKPTEPGADGLLTGTSGRKYRQGFGDLIMIGAPPASAGQEYEYGYSDGVFYKSSHITPSGTYLKGLAYLRAPSFYVKPMRAAG